MIRFMALATLALAPCAQEMNTLTDQEKAEGWKLLFDGKTTEGWRGYKKDKCPDGWKAVDGALARVGGGGDIVTVEQFESYELALEWKVAEKGNSGVMFHVAETKGPPYHTGPEMQVLDNERHPDGKNPKTSSGSCYALYAPSKNVCNPAGQWNKAKLVVNGAKVDHWLNGEKIVSYELGSEEWNAFVAASKFKAWPDFGKGRKGHLCLQDHGDRVEYRNIKIKVLKQDLR